MTNLQAQVEQTLRKRRLCGRGERMLVAVSGGVDSMVLLQLLAGLASRFDWKLTVAHFNHQLRGRSSDADERLVHKTATALGLQFVKGGGAVRAAAKSRRESIEMAARALRHEFLARTARRLKCRVIATGHHADDQVELFFLRLLRGSGGEGLAGMKWRGPSPAHARVEIIRPLLDVDRAALEHFARENKIKFRHDASNAARDIPRNRIRHELLPQLRRHFQPALNQTVLRAMDVLGGEADCAMTAARRWLVRSRPAFNRLAVAVQRHAIQLQLHDQKLRASFDLIECLRLFAGKPIMVQPRLCVIRNAAGRLSTFTPPASNFDDRRLVVQFRGSTGKFAFDGAQFQWRLVKGGRAHPQAAGLELFDANAVGNRIVLRHWQRGDRFQPIGMASSVKLQDWFTNRKVPRSRRHELIVATTARGKIFWIEGQRIGDGFKLTTTTKQRLIWSWRHG